MMIATTRKQKKYDHRLKDVVRATGRTDLARQHEVPESTARGWISAPRSEVVTSNVDALEVVELQRQLAALEEKTRRLQAIARCALARARATNASLDHKRIPDGKSKQRLMASIERARSGLPLRKVLKIVGLSASRYHAWKRSQDCKLDDSPSCPRLNSQQLTTDEVATIKEMVTSEEYRPVPTGTLAILAQRHDKVYASPSTWRRLVRSHGWRRPRTRIHPLKPRVGIRATSPNEVWHIDMTVIRLINGEHLYLHAVLDNYSRRILSWRITETLSSTSTVENLNEAVEHSEEETPKVIVDGGGENLNPAIDELIESGKRQRLLARTDIASSNSMIESWWRTLKHQWLFLNTLDSLNAVKKHVAFYVDEYNKKLPHSAFRGQTPDEMYFGTGDNVPHDLEAKRVAARQSRLQSNRGASCKTCEPLTEISS
jgi:transposase InsO family protein